MGSLWGFPVTPGRASSGGQDKNGHSSTVPRDPQAALGRDGDDEDEDSSQP